MGHQSITERVRHWIGSVAWHVFMWANWDGDEMRYINVLYEEESRWRATHD